MILGPGFGMKAQMRAIRTQKRKGDHGDDGDDENLGEEHSKTEGETSSKVLKQKLK